jgi:hypothetical protein
MSKSSPVGPLEVRTLNLGWGWDLLFVENDRFFNELIGAARGIRTPDPIITNDVLYQLSYCGPFE